VSEPPETVIEMARAEQRPVVLTRRGHRVAGPSKPLSGRTVATDEHFIYPSAGSDVVHGHEEVPAGGQVAVPTGGQKSPLVAM